MTCSVSDLVLLLRRCPEKKSVSFSQVGVLETKHTNEVLWRQRVRELTSLDVGECEEADANVSVDRPLLRLAIRTAAVVDEPSRVSLGAGVDHSILNGGGGRKKIQTVSESRKKVLCSRESSWHP